MYHELLRFTISTNVKKDIEQPCIPEWRSSSDTSEPGLKAWDPLLNTRRFF
jgi:hypothetical protein